MVCLASVAILMFSQLKRYAHMPGGSSSHMASMANVLTLAMQVLWRQLEPNHGTNPVHFRAVSDDIYRKRGVSVKMQLPFFIVRQYRYAQCTQLGYMKITSPNGIFPNVITADYQYGLCADIFGETYDRFSIEQASRALDIQYGSRNQQASNVVYTNGMLDPWIDHAITDDIILNSRVLNINCKMQPNLLHSTGNPIICFFDFPTDLSVSGDLESIAGWQSAEVRRAKEIIMDLIAQWVLGYGPVPYAREEIAVTA